LRFQIACPIRALKCTLKRGRCDQGVPEVVPPERKHVTEVCPKRGPVGWRGAKCVCSGALIELLRLLGYPFLVEFCRKMMFSVFGHSRGLLRAHYLVCTGTVLYIFGHTSLFFRAQYPLFSVTRPCFFGHTTFFCSATLPCFFGHTTFFCRAPDWSQVRAHCFVFPQISGSGNSVLRRLLLSLLILLCQVVLQLLRSALILAPTVHHSQANPTVV